MQDKELEKMEAALAAVGDRMASERSWEDVAPRVSQLFKPYRDLCTVLALSLAFFILGFWHRGVFGPAVAFMGLFLPGLIRAARERRRAVARQDRDLFAVCAEEVKRRYELQCLLLVLGPLLVIAFLVVGIALPDSRTPFLVACALTFYLPFHCLVVMPSTSRELDEVRRWSIAARELPLGAPEEAKRLQASWLRAVERVSRYVAVGGLVLLWVVWILDFEEVVPGALVWTVIGAWIVCRMLKAPEEDQAVTREQVADEDDEDDEEESWFSIIIGLLIVFVRVFLVYLAPIVSLILVGIAIRGTEPTRPLVVGGILAVASVIAWMTLNDDEEEDS